MEIKKCGRCNTPLPYTRDYFYIKNKTGRLSGVCKDCEKRRDRLRQRGRRYDEDKKLFLRARSKALGYLKDLYPEDYQRLYEKALRDIEREDAVEDARRQMRKALRNFKGSDLAS